MVAVAGEIYSAGLVLTIVKGIVTGSWWSFVFTALSIFGQIISIVVSGGAGSTGAFMP